MSSTRQAAVAAAVLLVAAVAGALVLRRDAPGDPRADGRSSVGKDVARPGDGAPLPTASPAPEGDGPGETALPAWSSPRPGAYRYRHVRTGDRSTSFEATSVVASAASGYTEARDRTSVVVKRSFAVKGSEVREASFALQSPSGVAACKWDRAFVVVPADRSEGNSWNAGASCTMTVGSTRTAVEVESASRVVGPRSASVEGVDSTLLRIDRKVIVRTTAGGESGERHSEFTDYFDTARGLLVQSTEDARETTPSGTTTYRIVETMLTVDPEVP